MNVRISRGEYDGDLDFDRRSQFRFTITNQGHFKVNLDFVNEMTIYEYERPYNFTFRCVFCCVKTETKGLNASQNLKKVAH